MGRAKMRIADVARETGLNRSTIAALYREDAVRVDLETMDQLCRLFGCGVGELFEYVPEPQPGSTRARSRSSKG